MMGTQNNQPSLFSYQVNLEQRVRPDNPLRRVQEVVDFAFVRAEVAPLYGYNGNESVDPVVMLKMMFLLFFEDIASERALMRIIGERLDYLWFLGYELDEPIPDHSVLSKARARWGRAAFEKFFVPRMLSGWPPGWWMAKRFTWTPVSTTPTPLAILS
ncbi:MAG: transposase [Nevskiales bacterium]